jgi:RNA-directed DNA polymerase
MLDQLKKCSDLDDLAALLGYKPKSLAYLIYRIPDGSKYVVKDIPKKNGQPRAIYAPIEKIKVLQRRLSDLLYKCLIDIEESSTHKRRLAFGYLPNRGIVENANVHKKSRYVFNLDLEDFFGAIHIGRVMGFFSKDQNFQLDPVVAKVIGQICCFQTKLPQGAPTSPIVSHFVGSILDARLARLATKHGCKYTRYVDDLTFSTNCSDFPAEIAVQDDSAQGWKVGTDLESRITQSGFAINATKTRLSTYEGRQAVTGLVSNAKANVTLEYRKNTRAMCHRLFVHSGPVEDQFYTGDDEDDDAASLNHIEGRLGHQYYVDHRFDDRSSSERLNGRSSRDRTFYEFLIFKVFFANDLPLIITEGDTDKIYLECASKALMANDPRFIDATGDAPKLAYRVLKRGKRLAQVMGWTGGTGPIQNAVLGYRRFRQKYPTQPGRTVIILVDNDRGSVKLFSVIKENFGVEIKHSLSDPFFKISDHLYLVKTPFSGTTKQTFIESFIPKTVLDTELEGRKFTSNNEYDKKTHFGKSTMAKYVSANQASISFTGYQALLDRIRLVFDDAGL